MAVTVASFKEKFPEFRQTDRSLCQSRIDMAKKRVAAGIWGNDADYGIMYLAAHLISIAPSGESAKSEGSGTTMYLDEFDRMKRTATAGVGRVT